METRIFILFHLVGVFFMADQLLSLPNNRTHQMLDITAALLQTKTTTAQTIPIPIPHHYHQHKHQRKNLWTVPIFHREALLNESYPSYNARIMARLARDSRRVEKISHPQAEFGNQVLSGVQLGTAEYVTVIGVGTPARPQFMVLDTGSNLVWLQCEPCQRCYAQSGQIFDPTTSASYRGAACSSPACQAVDGAGCRNGECRYQVSYGDGSSTAGTVVTETLTFSTVVVRNVVIGCGRDNTGLFEGAGGLLGLGRGPAAFPSQLGPQSGGVFSVCLADRDSVGSVGALVFGRAGFQPAASWAAMLPTAASPTYYYAAVAGIVVGGYTVPVEENAGVIVDTGTAVTRLRSGTYEAVRDAFLSGTAELPRAAAVDIFETCFDLAGFQSVDVPSVGLYLAGGPAVMFPARNYVIPIDSTGTFCLAIAPATVGPSIIGNIMLQHVLVSFDSPNSAIGFAVDQC